MKNNIHFSSKSQISLTFVNSDIMFFSTTMLFHKIVLIQVYKNLLLCNRRIALHLYASWPQVTCFYTSYDHLCVISGKMLRNERVSLQAQPTTQKVSSSTLIRDLIFEGKKSRHCLRVGYSLNWTAFTSYNKLIYFELFS